MSCGNCRKGMKLCPISFGLALGLTSGLIFLIWVAWMINKGMPMPEEYRTMIAPDWSGNLLHALWIFLKGFIFGFVLALIYDLFICIKGAFCRKKGCACGCGCSVCGTPTVDVNRQVR